MLIANEERPESSWAVLAERGHTWAVLGLSSILPWGAGEVPIILPAPVGLPASQHSLIYRFIHFKH